ncbi:hypothetical protein BC628DRAFT_1343952, partial [Trametes gibbosa]
MRWHCLLLACQSSSCGAALVRLCNLKPPLLRIDHPPMPLHALGSPSQKEHISLQIDRLKETTYYESGPLPIGILGSANTAIHQQL